MRWTGGLLAVAVIVFAPAAHAEDAPAAQAPAAHAEDAPAAQTPAAHAEDAPAAQPASVVSSDVAAPAAGVGLKGDASDAVEKLDGASEQLTLTASDYFAAASERYARGEYGLALAEFDAGLDATGEPTFLVNIGQCLRKLDRLDDAAIAYKRFLDLRAGGSRLRAEVWEALDELLGDLEGRLFRLSKSALYLREYLASGLGTPEERAQATQKHREILDQLVRVDDTLTIGLGRVHLLSIPEPRSLVVPAMLPPVAELSRTAP